MAEPDNTARLDRLKKQKQSLLERQDELIARVRALEGEAEAFDKTAGMEAKRADQAQRCAFEAEAVKDANLDAWVADVKRIAAERDQAQQAHRLAMSANAKLKAEHAITAASWRHACDELAIRARTLDALQAALDTERLAALIHDEWRSWAEAVQDEVSPERKARWQGMFVDYSRLPEKVKEQDRVWARKVAAPAGAVKAGKNARVCEETEDEPSDGGAAAEQPDREPTNCQECGCWIGNPRTDCRHSCHNKPAPASPNREPWCKACGHRVVREWKYCANCGADGWGLSLKPAPAKKEAS